MRYFWQILVGASALTLGVFLFFLFSLDVRDRIHFTDAEELTQPTVTIADPQRGPTTAPVTIVVFGDYQCAACARLEQSIETVRARTSDRVRVVWKDMPNSAQHDQATPAAIAAHCAGKQQRFWEYHDALFALQGALDESVYAVLAEQIGLDVDRFARCRQREETAALVERGFAEGAALRISATPTFWMNTERRTGEFSAQELTQFLDTLLANL